MPKKKNKNIMIKIGLFGCQTVGKTCLNSKYCFNKFYEKHNKSFPGLTEKTIERGNKTIQLKIFDTAGQERFNSLTKQYFQGLNGLFLVYDLTDKYFNENGTLKEGLTHDEKLETFLLELKSDAKKYEDIRKKIIDEDFNLSLREINLIALSFVYVQTSWEKMIDNLNASITNIKLIVSQLMEKKS